MQGVLEPACQDAPHIRIFMCVKVREISKSNRSRTQSSSMASVIRFVTSFCQVSAVYGCHGQTCIFDEHTPTTPWTYPYSLLGIMTTFTPWTSAMELVQGSLVPVLDPWLCDHVRRAREREFCVATTKNKASFSKDFNNSFCNQTHRYSRVVKTVSMRHRHAT